MDEHVRSWAINRLALTRLREAKNLTIEALAKLATMSERQLRRLESGETPTAYYRTVADLAAKLGCEPRDFAYPAERGRAGDPAYAAAVARGLNPPTPLKMQAPNIPYTAPDPKFAQREVAIGVHESTTEFRGSSYPLVGFHRLMQCELGYATIRTPFAIVGWVRDVLPMPDDAAALLHAEPGHNAVYALIRREIDGLVPKGVPILLELTVYATSAEHGALLSHCCTHRIPVKTLVKITARRRSEAPRGFPWFPAGAIRPWAFVADDVITG